MEKGESIRKFTAALVLLAKLFPHIGDRFFAQKFYQKLSGLVAAYVRLAGMPENSPNVAQYKGECLQAIREIFDILDIFSHLKLAPDAPLLFASHAVLRLRLALPQAAPVRGEEKPPVHEQKEPAVRARKPRIRKEGPKLNPNQEKIFNFVKKFPDVRTKDVIEQFSSVSERTVKRNLKDLVRSGLLRKRSENKAVFYAAVESN